MVPKVRKHYVLDIFFGPEYIVLLSSGRISPHLPKMTSFFLSKNFLTFPLPKISSLFPKFPHFSVVKSSRKKNYTSASSRSLWCQCYRHATRARNSGGRASAVRHVRSTSFSFYRFHPYGVSPGHMKMSKFLC